MPTHPREAGPPYVLKSGIEPNSGKGGRSLTEGSWATPNQAAWVSHLGLFASLQHSYDTSGCGASIVCFDPKNGAVVCNNSLCGIIAYGLGYDETTQQLFGLFQFGNNGAHQWVVEISTTTWRFKNYPGTVVPMPVEGSVAYSSKDHILFFMSRGNNLVRYDTARNVTKSLLSLPAGVEPRMLFWNAMKSRLYAFAAVNNRTSTSVIELNPLTGQILHQLVTFLGLSIDGTIFDGIGNSATLDSKAGVFYASLTEKKTGRAMWVRYDMVNGKVDTNALAAPCWQLLSIPEPPELI